MKKNVKICETLLRDAHQSLLATRMRTGDMLKVAAQLDRIGFTSLDVWGGATFDSALRYLGEDPWERLRALRKAMPNSKLQMLVRGQHLVGYKHYPDDIVERFIVNARKNGIDIFRIFDALNDTRNMEWVMKIAKREKAHVQAAIAYTISPVHDIKGYVATARRLAELGADSICIKDLAGILSPFTAYELVSALKKEPGLPLQIHIHYTTGMGTATLLKAIEAGVDSVDTAISSMAMSASQPPTETMVTILQNTEYDTCLNLNELTSIARLISDIRLKYKIFEAQWQSVEWHVLRYHLPGNMMNYIKNSLGDQKMLDKLYDVMDEVLLVRKDLGYPPLLTPLSQIIASQAIWNIRLGERYKIVTDEVKDYIRGCHGRPPSPVEAVLLKKAIGADKPIDCRPADLLSPGMEDAKREIGSLAKSEEDILSYALFPQIAQPFLERRAKGLLGQTELAAAAAAMLFHQHDTKRQKSKHMERKLAALSPWKLSSRAKLLRR
jgi:oxaloacetate decarboxylase (Na+ extruding) subunit alpha